MSLIFWLLGAVAFIAFIIVMSAINTGSKAESTESFSYPEIKNNNVSSSSIPYGYHKVKEHIRRNPKRN